MKNGKNGATVRLFGLLALMLGLTVGFCMLGAVFVKTGVVPQGWLDALSAVCTGLGVMFAGVISAKRDPSGRAVRIGVCALMVFVICLIVGRIVFGATLRGVGAIAAAIAIGASLSILTTNSKGNRGGKRTIRKRTCKKK